MTPRLILAKVTKKEWTFTEGEMAGKVFVHSPLGNKLPSSRLVLYRTNEKLHSRLVRGASDTSRLDFKYRFLKNQKGVMWIPTQGHFRCCRHGFVLKGRDDNVIATFGPLFDKGSDGNFLDWGTILNAHGIALLVFRGTKFESEAAKNAWPVVVLDDSENGVPERESEEGWINPLVVSYSHIGAIPGINKELDDKTTNAIDKEIASAINWELFPLLGKATMRRFVGWSAISNTIGKNPFNSRLTSLLCAGSFSSIAKSRSAFVADLAALDELGGCFECLWDLDNKVTKWQWCQPEELGAGPAQLARHLACRLGLEVVLKPDNKTMDVFNWNLRMPPPRRREAVPLEKSDVDQGIVGRLGALSDIGTVVADAPTLQPLACALKEEAEILNPDVARLLFQPLDAAFIPAETGILLLDPRMMFKTIERQFFLPKSPVLIPITAVKLINFDHETREEFEKEFGGRWIDLFRSPGRGAAETLRAIIGTGNTAAKETIWKDGWWSAFWRHCVVGEQDMQFCLGIPDRKFLLGVSRLDQAPLG